MLQKHETKAVPSDRSIARILLYVHNARMPKNAVSFIRRAMP